jgi:hypothetical protein
MDEVGSFLLIRLDDALKVQLKVLNFIVIGDAVAGPVAADHRLMVLEVEGKRVKRSARWFVQQFIGQSLHSNRI